MLDCRVSFYLLQTTFVSISKIDSILARLSIGQIRGLHDGAVPEAGEVRAQFISAQLKTKKTGNFSEKTAETFSFICDQRDLDYWSQANIPVILIVARLSDRLICWKSVQTWFADTERRRTRKVIFDKKKDCLDDGALPGFGATVASFAAPRLIVKEFGKLPFLHRQRCEETRPATDDNGSVRAPIQKRRLPEGDGRNSEGVAGMTPAKSMHSCSPKSAVGLNPAAAPSPQFRTYAAGATAAGPAIAIALT
jgi:Domain of unknown function (DUF4365)